MTVDVRDSSWKERTMSTNGDDDLGVISLSRLPPPCSQEMVFVYLGVKLTLLLLEACFSQFRQFEVCQRCLKKWTQSASLPSHFVSYSCNRPVNQIPVKVNGCLALSLAGKVNTISKALSFHSLNKFKFEVIPPPPGPKVR